MVAAGFLFSRYLNGHLPYLKCYEIWNVPYRIKPKENYVRISMKEIWRNLDGPPKNKELWIYVVSFEFSWPKVAQIGPSMNYFSFQPVFHDWCTKGRGMCYPVCVMMYIKSPLLLIGKSSPCGGSGFLYRYLNGPLPYIMSGAL